MLSACMLEPSVCDVVRDILAPIEMYADANNRILAAIFDLQDQNKPVDIVAVAGVLRDAGHLDRIGGTPYLAQLADATPAVAHVEEHARRVKEKARLRRIISVCQVYAAAGYGDVGSVAAWSSEVEQAIFTAASEDASADGAEGIDDILRRVVSDVWDRKAGRVEGPLGLPGITRHLTDHLNGYRRGKPYVVGARPGVGKSAFAMQQAVEVARGRDPMHGEIGEFVLFESAEMTKEELVLRALSQESRINIKQLETGKLNREECTRIVAAATLLAKIPLYLKFRPGANIAQIRGDVRRAYSDAKKRFGESLPLGMVVVDYLQVLKGERYGGDSREVEIAGLSRGFMQMAGELNCVLLVLSQLNRESEKRGGAKEANARGKRPQLSDLRESGAIEQDAYGVIFLYRDEMYFPDSPNKGICEFIIAKLRGGSTGTVRAKFTPEYTRFDDLAPEEYDFGQNDDWHP